MQHNRTAPVIGVAVPGRVDSTDTDVMSSWRHGQPLPRMRHHLQQPRIPTRDQPQLLFPFGSFFSNPSVHHTKVRTRGGNHLRTLFRRVHTTCPIGRIGPDQQHCVEHQWHSSVSFAEGVVVREQIAEGFEGFVARCTTTVPTTSFPQPLPEQPYPITCVFAFDDGVLKTAGGQFGRGRRRSWSCAVGQHRLTGHHRERPFEMFLLVFLVFDQHTQPIHRFVWVL